MPTILLKKSDTPGSVPGTANLTNLAGGVEVAVNTADKRMFSMTSASAVIELGTNPSSLTCADASFTVARVGSLTISSLSLTNATFASATITNLTSTSATISSALTLSGGTANGVLYLNGSKVATSGSALVFDGTNLGVGVSSPAYPLQVRRAGGAGSLGVSIDGVGSISRAVQYYAVGDATNATTGHVWYYRPATATDTVGMVLNGDGNVGIGTSSPGDKIHAASATAAGLSLQATGAGGSTWRILSTDSDASIGGGYLGFNNGSYRMVLDSSGNLGIGTSSPAAKLDVVGGTGIRVNEDGSSTKVIQVRSNFAGVGPAINVVTNDPLLFQTNNTERARITAGGDFGIGTSSPASKLDVNGVIRCTSGSIVTVVSYLADAGVTGTISNHPYVFYANNAERARITAGGDLLVGTTTAAWAASGRGLVEINGSSSFLFGGKVGGTQTAYFAGSSGGAEVATTTSTPLIFTTNNAERARFDSSGNFGVGTTSIASGGAGTVNVNFHTPSANPVYFKLSNASTGNTTSDGFDLIAGSDGSALLVNRENQPMIFYTNATERARISAGGDFEIGAQAGTGTRTLNIQTNTSGDPTINLTAAGADIGSFWFERATARLYARASNTGGVYLASGGTSWTAVSDERKKDIIEPIANAAEKVASLRAVVGKYKTDKDGVRRSFLIAQDVRAVFPEAVDASDENELGLSYTDTIPLLVAAIKEQQAMINELKAKVAALEAK